MAEQQWHDAVLAAASCAAVLHAHDIPELLQAAARVHAVGPILDPTLYRERSAAMDQDAALLLAALPLWEYFAGTRAQARIS